MTLRSRLAACAALALATAALAAPDQAGLDKAMGTLASGDVLAARGQIAQVVAANPDWADALVAQAQIALAAGDGAFAETKLRLAWKKGVKQAELRHLFAHAFLIQGRPADAANEAGYADIPAKNAAYAARIRARALWQTGDRAGSFVAIDRAVQLAPNDAQVLTDLAGLQRDVGNVAGALASAERAVARDPRNATALILSGDLVRDRYGYAAALPWYERAIAVQPGNLTAMLARAATLGDLGRARDMLAATREIQGIAPYNPRAYYLQAVLAARAGDWATTRSLLYRIKGRLGELPGLRLLAGVTELAQGNGEQAIIELRPLVARQPLNVPARRALASAYVLSGDFRAVIDTIRPLAERVDADSYALTLMGRACERVGDRQAAGYWLDRAQSPLKGPAQAFPGRGWGGDTSSGNPGVIVYAGDTLSAQGNWRGAADAYRKAANLAFTDTIALRLIDALRHAGDDKAALAVVAAYRDQNPRSVSALLLASDAALAGRDWSGASATLGEARRIAGDRDATLLNNLGWAAANAGRADDAVAYGRAAYALSPNSAPVAASYGWFAHLAGDKASAVALLEKAVALGPDVPQYRDRLAKARAGR